MSILTSQLQRTRKLIGDAAAAGIPFGFLIEQAKVLEMLIKQAECIHDPEPTPFNTRHTSGIIWICKKCNKIIDTETDK